MTAWPHGNTTPPPFSGQASSGPRATSEYGMRVNPVDGGYRLHAGLDTIGYSDIRSPVNGTVNRASWTGGFGVMVEIRAANGDLFRHAHLVDGSVTVKVGQTVQQGQILGRMGTTGNSTGVHLHWETSPGGGGTINPRDYMDRNTTEPDPEEEEEDEMLRMMHWTGGSVVNPTITASATRRALWDSRSGLFMEWTESGAQFANTMATNWETGASAGLTQSLANAILQACRIVASPQTRAAIDANAEAVALADG